MIYKNKNEFFSEYKRIFIFYLENLSENYIMILLINKPLEYCLRIVGLWPYKFNILGPVTLILATLVILPFQCWHALNSTNDIVLLMDELSDTITEVLILIKIIIIWKNRR